MAIQKNLKTILQNLGTKLRREGKPHPRDLRNIRDIDPVCLEHSAKGQTYFISVPVNKLIHMEYMAFGLDKKSRSPYLATTVDYLDGHQAYEGSQLEKYHQLCKPSSVAEFMDIDNPENSRLNRLNPSYAPRIFSPDSLRKSLRKCKKRTLRENMQITGQKLGLEAGCSMYGPALPSKGRAEFARLTGILNSVQQHGYNFDLISADAISGFFLLDDTTNEWVVAANSGQHRVACLAALGFNTIPVHIKTKGGTGTLKLSQTKNLPIVRNGIISRQEADSIFLRKISKQPPACAQEWVSEADRL